MDVITNLKNYLLIATSQLEDSIFDTSIVYIYKHNDEGAMGVIVNHPMKDVTFEQIVNDIGVAANIEGVTDVNIYQGGPVEVQRGFVIHSAEYKDDDTLKVSDNVSISSTGDIVSAIANNRGPKQFNFCLGYAGWGPGQLEDEVAQNAWLPLPNSNDILFAKNPKKRYELALKKIGMSGIPETDNIGIC